MPNAESLDHLLNVVHRLEDVVTEEPVAVVDGLLQELRGADRAMPHKWRDVVEGTRDRRE